MAGHMQQSVSTPPDSREHRKWCREPEVPLAAEIMASEPPVLPKIDEARCMPKDEYLEAQYRLHRYEATELLRRAVVQYRQNPTIEASEHAFIYRQAFVTGYKLTRFGAACRISAELPGSDKFGEKPTLPVSGSLMALSTRFDGFRNKCFVATVARDTVDDASPAFVEIFWADSNDAVIDPTLELVMLQPKEGYFESVRHVMVGLQQAASSKSKFDAYLYEPSQKSHRDADYLRETPRNSAIVPKSACHLDPSQLQAFQIATSRELAIIQGPPGTGKTFTSLVAIESHVKTLQVIRRNQVDGASHPMPPVIIAAQTNHALDQLLSRCIDLGIGKPVRLGGRSQDDKIKEWSMQNVRQRSKATKPNGRERTRRSLARELQLAMKKCWTTGLLETDDLREAGLITDDQHRSLTQDEWETGEEAADGESSGAIAKWLDDYVQQRDYQKAKQNSVQQSDHGGAGKVERDGEFVPIEMASLECILKALHDCEGGNWLHRAKRLLARHSDMYRIKPAERGSVYCFLYKEHFAEATSRIQDLLRLYNENCDGIQRAQCDNNVRVIHAEGIQILGCTTTGLVKYRGLLAQLRPRILLIEEAAETREANIIAALFPSIEQLVLVGDHQQLTPHADLRELCDAPHRLSFSLFERMVNVKVPYCALRVQRRMIPRLREVVQVFYPNLTDHAIVKDPHHRPPVPGMGGRNLWWFRHQWPQARTDGSGFSFWNLKEASMIVGFTQYLVMSGADPKKITILAYYNGQVGLIRKQLMQNAYLSSFDVEWSVRTIDGFQGEENDIILLSLVRGPDGNRKAMPGFVADENRAVVATSRGRCGFYIFGNSDAVLRGNSRSQRTWEKVFDVFGRQNGEYIPITTAAGAVINIHWPEEWRRVLADHKGSSSDTPIAGTSGRVEDAVDQIEAQGLPGTPKPGRHMSSDELLQKGMRNVFFERETQDVDTSSDSEGDVLISFTP
ncbi:hypothetical protein CDD83_9660 [Cordyceps sp. RAO-2017]|nr:hypothetical protein CDD83_9660 [Cordyceps sp. RAO-2017]